MVKSNSRCAVVQGEEEQDEEEGSGDDGTVLSSSATKIMKMRLDGCWCKGVSCSRTI